MNSDHENIEKDEQETNVQIDPETGEPILDDPDEELMDDVIEDQFQELQELKEERNRLQDQLLRSMADLQNFRKRALAEKQTLQKFATEDFVRDLLPILDNFERTLSSIDAGANLEAISEGVGMINRQMRGVLDARGVKRIESVGKPFDPAFHDAIVREPATDEFPAGTVTAEIEGGYMMGDRVVRAARVKVAE